MVFYGNIEIMLISDTHTITWTLPSGTHEYSVRNQFSLNMVRFENKKLRFYKMKNESQIESHLKLIKIYINNTIHFPFVIYHSFFCYHLISCLSIRDMIKVEKRWTFFDIIEMTFIQNKSSTNCWDVLLDQISKEKFYDKNIWKL